MTQEDATVTLDELRALLDVLREPEDATPRTANERGWNRALDAVFQAASRYVRDALSVEGREAGSRDEQVAAIAAALEQAGFDPPDNVCAASGVFEIVAISEPDTRPVAEALAAMYVHLGDPA